MVFQDFLSKWPFVFAEKAVRIARLLAEEVIPVIGVPVSDRGTNLLSHLMRDLCQMLGITRTLKTVLRKHAATFSRQWDRSSQECCGHIATPLTNQQGKSPHSCCWEWIAEHQQKQPTYLLHRCVRLVSQIIGADAIADFSKALGSHIYTGGSGEVQEKL